MKIKQPTKLNLNLTNNLIKENLNKGLKNQKVKIELGEISKSEQKNVPPQVAPVPPKNYLEVEQDLKAHFAANEGERQMMIERALFRGDLDTEIMKFCEHHNENKNFLNKPIRNIIPKLTGWLRRSAQFDRNDRATTGKTREHKHLVSESQLSRIDAALAADGY